MFFSKNNCNIKILRITSTSRSIGTHGFTIKRAVMLADAGNSASVDADSDEFYSTTGHACLSNAQEPTLLAHARCNLS